MNSEVKIWSQRERVTDDFNSRISDPKRIKVSLYAPIICRETEIPFLVLQTGIAGVVSEFFEGA